MFELHPQLAEETVYLGDFPLSALLLSRDASYPWFILVPRVPAITEIHQLDAGQRIALMEESCALAERLQIEFSADKLNIAALGNVVPQLHLHHIVRYRDDTAWPGPIWGVSPPAAYTSGQLSDLLARVGKALSDTEFSLKRH